MPVESATYISQLNTANPPSTDGVLQGDDHLRLIKGALKNNFPNFTAAALTATQAELDAAVTANKDGTNKFASGTNGAPGIAFKDDTNTGFSNPAADTIRGLVGGQQFVQANSDKSVDFAGEVTATGGFVGPGTVPIGGTMIWWSDTLPTAADWGTYDWCNGGTYPRSNTALFAILGTRYGTGNGTTTANLPDLRDNVPVGKSDMGGAGDANRILSGVTGFTNSVLGAMLGASLHTLTKAQLPDITIPFDWRHEHHVAADAQSNLDLTASNHLAERSIYGGASDSNADLAGAAADATVGLSSEDGAVSNIPLGGSGDSHNNVQPSIVCNWIIRVA